MPPSQRLGFGDFVLERSQQRVCRRDGSPLTLTPRLFSALLLFVENAGALLDKDALMRALWPGVVVEENSLSQVISGLRRALADDSHDSRYIQTVPRRGFRFIATVIESSDATSAGRLASASNVPELPGEGAFAPSLGAVATGPVTSETHGAGLAAPDRRRWLRARLQRHRDGRRGRGVVGITPDIDFRHGTAALDARGPPFQAVAVGCAR